MTKKCIGCGVLLQSDDKKKIGYVPSLDNNAKYCERCFRITHYNDALAIKGNDFQEIIDIINKKSEYTIFVVDILNINNESISLFHKIKNKKLLVINKIDLLPKGIKINKIENWLKKEYQIRSKIHFVSAKNNKNIVQIVNYLEKEKINKAYLVGLVNSGKSTLINHLYELYQNTSSVITTSLIPNTTLDFINAKINNKLTLIDSPGIIIKSIIDCDNFELIKIINKTSYLKLRTFQMKKHDILTIENIIYIENLGEKNSFTFYGSNLLNLYKVYDFKISKKEILVDENSDIIIKGLGFINVKKAGKLKIEVCDSELIEIRKSWYHE